MTFLDILILSIVEGVTEFLPISSTAHLLVAADLLQLPSSDFLSSFMIFIQLGAIGAVVTLYFDRIVGNLKLIKKLLLAWLLIAYIPVSVTGDSIPHALRTLISAPTYQLICAFGFLIFINWIKKYSKFIQSSLIVGLLIFVVLSLGYYLNQYYNIYPKNYSRDWQYGYQQAVSYVNEHKNEYDQIVFSRHYGEPHMFTLFFLKLDPSKYQNDPNLERFETHDWVRVLRFDMFYLTSSGEEKKVPLYFPDLGDKETTFSEIVKENPGKKLLFIGREIDFPNEMPRLLKINFLNGDNAFDIVEMK